MPELITGLHPIKLWGVPRTRPAAVGRLCTPKGSKEQRKQGGSGWWGGGLTPPHQAIARGQSPIVSMICCWLVMAPAHSRISVIFPGRK
jgi:hypothetical protein